MTVRPRTPVVDTKSTKSQRAGRKLAVAATAVPAVMLSSLALSQPAAAAPVQAQQTQLPAAVTLPASVTIQTNVTIPASPKVPESYTVQRGDTVFGIAKRFNVPMVTVQNLNQLSGASVIYPGQKLRLVAPKPAAKPAPKPAAKPAPKSAAPATYTVRGGDTLSSIASKHKVELRTLLSANKLSMNSVIYPGQKLRLAPEPVAAPKPAPKPVEPTKYTIRPGDTLSSIASKHKVSVKDLAERNGISTTSVIFSGRTLTIPGTGTPAPTANPGAQNLVPSTFLHYTYPAAVVADANRNKALLLSTPQPSQAQMRQIVADTARQMGVNPALALAIAHQESGFQQTAVSPANAIGTMQVIPSSGEWASAMVGRKLNLLDPYDNVVAGVAILRSLTGSNSTLDKAIGSYYQGQGSVEKHGFFSDTKKYVSGIRSLMKQYS